MPELNKNDTMSSNIIGMKIHVASISYGTEEIHLEINGDHIKYRASYIGEEPLSSLIEVAEQLELDDGWPCTAKWQDEPGLLELEFKKTEDDLCIKVMEYNDQFDGKDVISCHEYGLPYRIFRQAVIQAARETFCKYGIVGFFRSWEQSGEPTYFPFQSLLILLGDEVRYDESTESSYSSLEHEARIMMDFAQDRNPKM